MKPVAKITKHISSPWDICGKCGDETFSFVDVNAENVAERIVWSCKKCGPVQILTATPQIAKEILPFRLGG